MKKLLLTTIALGLVTGSANAAIIGTDSDTIDLQPTELDGSLSIAPFTGSGTVTSVGIQLSGLIESNVRLTNTGAEEQSGSASTNSDFTFTSPSGDVTLPSGPQLQLSADTGPVTLDPGADELLNVDDSDSTSSTVSTGLADLLDGFSLALTTDTGLNVDFGGGNVLASQDSQGSATLTATFNGEEPQAEVPLPGTLPMLVSGLGALGFFGWRRRNA